MLNQIKDKSIYFYYFSVVSTLALFLVTYLQQRSIFIDEAHLALNLVEKSYSELFGKLDNEQYAPIPFLILSKSILHLFGLTEWSLRLLPILFSLGNIYLLDRFTSKINEDYLFKGIVIFLFGWQVNNILFASEFKQYSMDLFVCLSLMNYFRSQYVNPFLSIIIGSICIWFSMPSVFLLPAYYANCIYRVYRQKESPDIVYAFMPIVWGASFLGFYKLVLVHGVHSDFMKAFHEQYFWPIIPISGDDFKQMYFITRNILIEYFSASIHQSILIVPIVILGIRSLFQRRKRSAILLSAPILMAVAASGLGYYSLIPRTLYFCIPFFYISLTEGLFFIFNYEDKKKIARKVAIGIGLVILIPMLVNGKHIVEQLDRGQARMAILALANAENKVTHAMIFPGAYPTYRLYTVWHKEKDLFQFPGEIYGVNNNSFLPSLKMRFSQKPYAVISVLWGHTMNDAIESHHNAIKEKYTILESSTYLRSSSIIVSKEY